ncbi:YjfI family protein [Pseudoxanthomonas sp. UTMC 1351]|uniref:YjfI family protein n=1 Tax=Pseudoxanthomonas sp. UTMC 1351 TaxID=2695853 RepID=UPI0034CE3D52
MSHWTIEQLQQRLAENFGGANVAVLEDAENALQVVLAEAGDLEITLVLSEDQIYVSTPLVTGAQVQDRAAFNDACLRMNPINPLSNLGLSTVDGQDVYVVFGELSADSTETQIVLEIRTLGINAIDAIESLKPFLVKA